MKQERSSAFVVEKEKFSFLSTKLSKTGNTTSLRYNSN